jgi:hypothetical protein
MRNTLEINMNTPTPLLTGTRWLIYGLMGLIGLVAVFIMLMMPLAAYGWEEIVAELVKQNPKVRTDGLLPVVLIFCTAALGGLAAVFVMLKKLMEIIKTVGEGDPFVAANAARLRLIGWVMVIIQVAGVPISYYGNLMGEKFGSGYDSDELSLSVNGILAILLVFVLAHVFERGAAMRDELEGTV